MVVFVGMNLGGVSKMKGGVRKGAGRPPGTTKENRRVKVGYVVSPETAEWIKQQAASRGIGQGRVIDELVISHKK